METGRGVKLRGLGERWVSKKGGWGVGEGVNRKWRSYPHDIGGITQSLHFGHVSTTMGK